MAAYSNPALPPKTMMKIYKAATPDGGSELNVLKFSQVTLRLAHRFIAFDVLTYLL